MRVRRSHVEEFVRLQAADLKNLRHGHCPVILAKTEPILDCTSGPVHDDCHAKRAAHVQRLAERRRDMGKDRLAILQANSNARRSALEFDTIDVVVRQVSALPAAAPWIFVLV
jgi:hypothetical protein